MASLLEPHTVEQEEEILKEINYPRKQLNQDLITLGEWLDDQEHLPPSKKNEDSKFLSGFLTGTKGSLQTAKRKLDNYYTLRSTCQIFEDRDPLSGSIKNTLANFVTATTPKPMPDGSRLSFVRCDAADPDDYDFLGTVRRIVQVTELRMRIDNGISAGEYFCLDGKGYTASHLVKVNPVIVREALTYIQEAVPARIKMFMFINCPQFVEVAVNRLIKPFLKKKLADRVFVTSDGASFLQSKFPKEVLPKDYGGDLPDLETMSKQWQKACEEKRDWYINDLSEKTNEEKRPKDSERISENPLFGVQGSLKQLVID
ncbi:SEC14 [Nesidiocoris tenuis]|uniref:SEC14 n=1 Tax=Nesidiocoris tenuis TaxID=355587 RepID=A0ABN7A628_9HEMI|nr:SEC14 [Nesidiocoris tenuis]